MGYRSQDVSLSLSYFPFGGHRTERTEHKKSSKIGYNRIQIAGREFISHFPSPVSLHPWHLSLVTYHLSLALNPVFLDLPV
jgi:hypothetical protein